MQKLKENKGITLVALIVTIIVLLILSGVAISQLGQNGLFNKTRQATEETRIAEAQEILRQKAYEVQIAKAGNAILQDFVDYLGEDEEKEFIISLPPTASISGTTSVGNIDEIYVTYNEYSFKVTSTFDIEYIELTDIQAYIEAKGFENGKVNSIIKVMSSTNGIKTVKVPLKNIEINGNGKTSIGVDAIIDANVEYIVEIELLNGTKETKKVIYEDTEGPDVTINLSAKLIFAGKGNPVANVKMEDKSGINISNCKWVINTSNEEIGSNDELYTGGIFKNSNDIIELKNINTLGKYYIHILSIDNLGHKVEKISEEFNVIEGTGIYTAEELQAIPSNAQGTFYIMNDIDMAKSTITNFEPIDCFIGVLDGQGYSIKNLTIRTEDSNAAMFLSMTNGYNCGTVKNVKLENVDIYSKNGSASAIQVLSWVSGFGKITMENVAVTGKISGNAGVGSLTASYRSSETYLNCYAITDLYSSSGGYCGGLRGSIGGEYPSGEISNSYWYGTMNANRWVGPIAGSYNENNWSIGFRANNCFYNKTIFPFIGESYHGTGLTTSQFADANNFTGWDFENTWEMVTRTKIEIDSEGNETQVSETYPELKIFLQREREAQQAQNN